MIRKRLIGVVTVRQGHAVQSFGYSRYLPLGRPEVLIENLDRWGADEILLQCIDRSTSGLGPDFPLLERVSRMGLSTPLIYAGGIGTAADGIAVVQAGADRICLDALLHESPGVADSLAESLGAQALIASLPVTRDGQTGWLDYRSGISGPFSTELLRILQQGVVSEALIIDSRHEGFPGAFDATLLDGLPFTLPLIAFGGLSEVAQLRALLQHPQIVAAAIGNFLSYCEHAVQRYKLHLAGLPIRAASYEQTC